MGRRGEGAGGEIRLVFIPVLVPYKLTDERRKIYTCPEFGQGPVGSIEK